MNPRMFQRLLNEGDQGGGGGGAAAAAWFGDTNKDFVAGKGWKSGDDAIASYRNLETLVGAEKAGRTLVLPKDANDAEGLKSFRAKFGVPEAHTGYKIPDAMKEDKHIAGFAEVLHKHNVPASAFDGIMQWLVDGAKKNAEEDAAAEAAAKQQAKEASERELATLKTEWGEKFDQNAEFARRFLKEAGWDDARIQKYEATFGTASMLKDFFGWGSKTGELNYEGGSGSGGFSLNKQQALSKLDEYRQQRADGKINDMRWSELEPELDRLRKVAYAA